MADERSTGHDENLGSLHVILEGGPAELGSVPAADVAHLIEGSIRSIARAAEVLSGRLPRQVGRRGSTVETATRFILEGIAPGSVAIKLRAPSDSNGNGEGLSLEDDRLIDLAINKTMDSIEGRDPDAYLADGLAELGEELALGNRYQVVRFEFAKINQETRSVALDHGSTQRLRKTSSNTPEASANTVGGTLVEADFERMTARLRTPSDRQIKVTFEDNQADDIHEALRQKAELEGVVKYDSTTKEAISVETRSITRTYRVALDLAEEDFWRNSTVFELAEEQGVVVKDNVSALYDEDASREEVDSFFEALGL